MKKFFLVALVVMVLAVVVGIAIRRTRRVRTRVRVAEVDRDIHEHLHPGVSRTQVESYLDGRRIHHSYIDHSSEGPAYSRIESALIPESSLTWLGRGDIQIIFRFDDQDKLTQYSVKEIFTGP